MLILKSLARLGPVHGYGIALHIQQTTENVLQVEEGSLYPALQRMLIKGCDVGDPAGDPADLAGTMDWLRKLRGSMDRRRLDAELEEEIRTRLAALFLVALLACLVPARHAVSIHPIDACGSSSDRPPASSKDLLTTF